eukprot:EG_transcript_4076
MSDAASTKWKHMVDALGAENKELRRELQAKKQYISRMEAKLTTGGYVQRYAKLEERLGVLQREHKELEAVAAQRGGELERAAQQRAALQRALDEKVEAWARQHGDPGLEASWLLELGIQKERTALAEKQLRQEIGAREQLSQIASEATYSHQTLQVAYEQSALEVHQLQRHVEKLSGELHAMEQTKLVMLQALEDKVQEAEEVRGKLGPALESQDQLSALVEALKREKGALEERTRHAESKTRQLQLLKDLQDEKLLQANAQVAHLLSQLAETEAKMQSLATSHQELALQVGTSGDELQRVREELHRLAEDNRGLRGELEAAHAGALRQRQQAEGQAGEQDRLQRRLAEEGAARARLEETLHATIRRANAEAGQLQQRLGEAAAAQQHAQQEAEALRGQVGRLEQELAGLRGKDHTLHKAVVDKLQALRAEVEALKAERQRLQSMVGDTPPHPAAGPSHPPWATADGSPAHGLSSEVDAAKDGEVCNADRARQGSAAMAAELAELREANARLERKAQDLAASRKELVQRVRDKANAKLRERVQLFEDRFQLRAGQMASLLAGLQEQNQVLAARLASYEAPSAAASSPPHPPPSTTKACHYALLGEWLASTSPQAGTPQPFNATMPVPNWPAGLLEPPPRASHPMSHSPTAPDDEAAAPKARPRTGSGPTHFESLAAGGTLTPSECSGRTSPGRSPSAGPWSARGAPTPDPFPGLGGSLADRAPGWLAAFPALPNSGLAPIVVTAGRPPPPPPDTDPGPAAAPVTP